MERVTEEREGLRGIGSANEERKGERHRNRVGMMQTRNPEKGEKKGVEVGGMKERPVGAIRNTTGYDQAIRKRKLI